MRILIASSEVHPYSKTGGLGDMVGALAKSLAKDGHKVGLVTPLYRGTRQKFPALKPLDWQMDLPFGTGRIQGGVWTLEPQPGLTIYFIDQPEFFDRAGIYMESGWGYADNAERFIFFSKAVTHLARYLPWQPEVLHLHDWQTGLVPAMIRAGAEFDGWANPPRTIYTIHNLAYQGWFEAPLLAFANLPPAYNHPGALEFFSGFNCMKAGIVFCDTITTVSPRYAREITTEAFGCGLDGLLRERQDRLVGILNGVDYEEWNTEKNPALPHPYSVRSLAGKLADKLALQKEMGLPEDPSAPLFGNISRLVDQKGTDLLLGALEEMLPGNLQFVFLGSGDPALELACRKLAARFAGKVALKIGFDQPLSHRIEAGSDFYLMPSRFEPCGLNQMYSLRYGAVPVVRRTGGLDDAVIDIQDDPRKANGIKFEEYSSRALARGMRKALALYEQPRLYRQFQLRGMKADFSWERTAKVYARLYTQAL